MDDHGLFMSFSCPVPCWKYRTSRELPFGVPSRRLSFESLGCHCESAKSSGVTDSFSLLHTTVHSWIDLRVDLRVDLR